MIFNIFVTDSGVSQSQNQLVVIGLAWFWNLDAATIALVTLILSDNNKKSMFRFFQKRPVKNFPTKLQKMGMVL